MRSLTVVDTRSIRLSVFLYPLGLWVVMAIVAILNGVFREIVLIPRVGDYIGHVLSTGLLLTAILVLSFAYFHRTPIEYTRPELFAIGILWALLTVGFEFLVGYVEGTPVSVTLAQYNLFAGQVWIVVPLTLLLSPLLFGWHLSS
jgi:branched-subunit amino acid transport protein AzlD